MIDLQALRRRVSGEPDAQGAIGPVCLTLRESLALIDELEAARVDAARWNAAARDCEIGAVYVVACDENGDERLVLKDEADAEIDAAMASKAQR